MTKSQTTSKLTTAKPAPVFPAPEWTSVSSSLAAALAHEIRNPLLAIKGAAQLLEGVVGEDDKSLAALIIAESQRIEKLIATMDPLTPNPAQAMVPLNIHEVTEYVRLAASGFAPQVAIRVQYDPSLPELRGVREALIQALMNLVKNSVEALAVRSGVGLPLPTGERQDFPSEQREVRKSGEGASRVAGNSLPPLTPPLPLGERACPPHRFYPR